MNKATWITVLTLLVGLLATQGADAAAGAGAWLLVLKSFCAGLPGGFWFALLSVGFSGALWSMQMRRTCDRTRRPNLSADTLAWLAGPIPMLVASWGQGGAAIAIALMIGTIAGAFGALVARAINSALLAKPAKPLPAPQE
jgi:hypothetical protein